MEQLLELIFFVLLLLVTFPPSRSIYVKSLCRREFKILLNVRLARAFYLSLFRKIDASVR